MKSIIIIFSSLVITLQAQVMLPARKAIGVPPAQGWTPQRIGGLRYWWVASDLSSGPITGNWVDRIQGAYLTQPNTSIQPVADPITMKAVRFELGQYLTNSNPTVFNPLIDYGVGVGYSGGIFVIFQPVLPSGQTTTYGLIVGDKGNNLKGLFTRSTGTLTVEGSLGSTSYGTVTNFQYIETVLNVTNVFGTNGTLIPYLSGVPVSTNSPKDTWPYQERAGYNFNTWANYYEGWIFEIGFASNMISSADITNLHNYATNIYNVSALNTSLTNTAVFDGSNDYLRYTGAPSGLADGKQVTFSGWLKFLGGNGAVQRFFQINGSGGGTDDRFVLYKNAANKISVYGRNATPTEIIVINGNTSVTDASGWLHVYICFDLADAAKRKIYINGAAETLTVTTYINGTLDLSSTSYNVGSRGDATDKFNGALAEFWLDDSYLDDTTKFASGGHPISLGVDGSTPTGSAPVFYFHYPGNLFRVNTGTGGSFGLNGSLGQTTPP